MNEWPAVDAIADSARWPVFQGRGRVGWQERAVPRPGAGEVLLRVVANAVCGSDRRQWEQGSSVTPGHEVVGVVADVGTGTAVRPGTAVAAYLMAFCGSCASCSDGAMHQCRRKRWDLGFSRDGGYGPWVVVEERQLFPVDPTRVRPDEATLLLDVLGTSRHALARALAVRPGPASVLVVGCGPVGLGVVAAARLLLAAGVRVVVSDLVPARLELARALGADATVLWSAGTDEEGGAPSERFDLVFDTTGSERARAAALGAVDSRGVLVCVGHGGSLTLDVSRDLIAPERAVLGSEYFPYDLLPSGLELLLAHRERLAPIVTHRYGAERLEEALATFWGGATGKVVVTW